MHMSNVKAESQIQVRIDTRTKKQAQKTLDQMGLDMSSAIKLFLRSVISTQSIPFEIRTKNGFTPAQEARMIREVEETLKSDKSYRTAREMHEDILHEINCVKK